MSVVGFDIGNENCAIAVAKRGGIDVVLNDESKREMPAVVSFGEKQRFLGSSGAAFATKYPKSTISQIKRLIGRGYKEPSMQEELKLLPFETTEGPHGGVLIHLQYLNKTWTFQPVEILGMLLAHLKEMTEKNLDSPVVDCVKDIFPYSVGFRFDDGEHKRHPELTAFPKGSPFPTTKTVPYHGNITFCCEVFYTNKMDFPSGISPLVGRFMISPHLTSGEKSVKATVKVQLNAHGIFEIKSVSFLEVIHPLFDYSKLYSLMMMFANNLMKNGAAGYKTTGSTLQNTHSAVEPRSRAREQKLSVSENYHVMTTIDEMHKAQKRAQMFADQDIKVEKTKEKRNTLESFIYDTRSKLFSSFRSMATDSEVEIISKSLQETEEWLYEEGDDESEQVYIRKLEHLEKYLDPIENRYTDEKVRQETTRALQTCIQKNHLAADLLPPSQKEEVNNECIQAEWWLNQLSKLQDSLPKNATRIYCSGSISGITQAFKRRCEVIFSSKLPLPKFEEPVESDRKQNPNVMQVDS
ncbi:unnamed protein product [Lactuca virosa]|uniref:Uncharacterized protein n=1 Tax=Lactuca virosa TaxID=75947 RepID=A0AAU9PE38_9ASTR|nr:unnamed protein product [Lactuca virosa]